MNRALLSFTVAASGALYACQNKSAEESRPKNPVVSTSATGTVQPGSAAPPSRSVAGKTRGDRPTAIDAICKGAPCLGKLSRIESFVGLAGEVERYYYHSDPSVCIHGPSVYFDATGKRLDTIPNKPMDPKSERGKKILATHAEHQDGRTQGPKFDCGN